MVLSDKTIREELEEGDLSIERDGDLFIGPNTVDLHLDSIEIPYTKTRVKVSDPDSYPTMMVPGNMTLEPYEFALGTTQETVEIPDYLKGRIDGRSSVGRLGLFVENAGVVDAGFEGELTLELVNTAPYPIGLEVGMRICQIEFEYLTEPSERDYGSKDSKYQGQTGATGSRLYQDFTDD